MARSTLAKGLTATVVALSLSFGLSACSSHSNAKPTKAEFRSGLNTILEREGWHDKAKASGLPESTWNQYVNCVSDKSYSTLSEPLIKVVAEGRDVKTASDADKNALTNAVNACVSELTGK